MLGAGLASRARAAIGVLTGRTSVRNEALYESASASRRTQAWRPPTTSPNDILGSLTSIRDRSRAATRNNGYATGVIDELVRNVIGWGIRPLCKVADPVLRKNLQDAFNQWSDDCARIGGLSFYGQQALAVRGWFESGECFGRLRQRLPADGFRVPLQVELLEPDLCPVLWSAAAANGNRVRAGIEFNAIGQRTAYYFYPSRPDLPGDADFTQLKQVPADSVVHLFEESRPGQLRGLPRLTQALVKLNDLDKFDDATLLRQQVANLFAVFVTRPETLGDTEQIHPLTGLPITSTDTPPTLQWNPGIVQELAPGEDVKFSEPPAVANGYADFMRQQLRAICVASGVPYEVLTGDMGSVNDRTARVILNKFKRAIQMWQFNIVADKFLQPIWNAWVERGWLTGTLDLPGYATDPRLYQAVKWMPQRSQYINPVQDVQADKDAIRAGFTTRATVVSEYGEDAEQIDQEQRDDNARADDLGLRYDSDGRQPAAGPRETFTQPGTPDQNDPATPPPAGAQP